MTCQVAVFRESHKANSCYLLVDALVCIVSMIEDIHGHFLISVISGSDTKVLHIQAHLDPMQQINSLRFNTCESVLVITLSVPSAESQDGRGFVLQSGNLLTT